MTVSYFAEIGLQAGTTSVTLFWPANTLAGDMAVAWVANKLDSATPATPAGWVSLGSQAVGTGAPGVDTGPLRLSAFYHLLTQNAPASPVFTIASGNVAMGYGQVYRKAAGDVWFAPTATFGSDTTHGTAFSATGAANLGALVGDWVTAMSAGTANAGPSARNIEVPGTTGTLTGINSGGSAVGNRIFVWGDRYEVLTGSESAAPVSTGTFAVNQSGGAAFTRLGIAPTGQGASAAGGRGRGLAYHMNRKAGTLVNDRPTVDAQKAANIWAGTTGLEMVGALNVRAGNSQVGGYRELPGVLNQLAGTVGLEIDGAAASIP